MDSSVRGRHPGTARTARVQQGMPVLAGVRAGRRGRFDVTGPGGGLGAYSRACLGSIGISRAAPSARCFAFRPIVEVPQQRSYWFCQSVRNAS